MAFRFSKFPDLSLLQEEKFELHCSVHLLFAVQVCAVAATVLLFLFTVLKTSC